MATMTVKNIPENLYQKLKESAKANHRSINSEIIVVMEKAFFSAPLDVEAWLEKARKIREKAAPYVATVEEIEQAINDGRE